MKADINKGQIRHSPPEEMTTRLPQYGNEERIRIVSFIIGNLIFWGSLFYLFIADLL